MAGIGRGSSTYDFLALAWSAAEYLSKNVSVLTLFATHYFELTQFPELLPSVINVHFVAIEHEAIIALCVFGTRRCCQ